MRKAPARKALARALARRLVAEEAWSTDFQCVDIATPEATGPNTQNPWQMDTSLELSRRAKESGQDDVLFKPT